MINNTIYRIEKVNLVPNTYSVPKENIPGDYRFLSRVHILQHNGIGRGKGNNMCRYSLLEQSIVFITLIIPK